MVAIIAAPARAQSDCVSATGPDTIARVDSLKSRAAQGQPDLRILASMSADEITFAKQPRICVRLWGDAKLDSVRVVGRKNLASPVVSGTTYRNVFVAVEILGHLNASCIASRITGARTDSTSSCASIGVETRTP